MTPLARTSQTVSVETAAPLSARELRARQLVLAADTLDAWRTKFMIYHTTVDDCECADFLFRGREVGACKHMLALRLLAEREALA